MHKTKRKIEHVNVVVAFGDVSGFGVWTRRASPSAQKKFIKKLRLIFRGFKKEGDFFKTFGDGFLIILEVNRDQKSISEFLRRLWEIYLEMDTLIKDRTEWPRPIGFRVVAMSGIALRFPCERDYYGYVINTCQKLMLRARKHDFMVHQSIFEKLTDKTKDENGFEFRKIRKLRSIFGVDLEDLESLYAFRIQDL